MSKSIGALGAIAAALALFGIVRGASAAPGPQPSSGTPADDLTGDLNLPKPGGPDPEITYPGQPGWGEGYMCTFCGKLFASPGELNHHRADVHYPAGTVTFCRYDDEMFFTSSAEGLNGYKMHMQFYHGEVV